jgi:glycine cleavage system H protein
MSYPADRLYHGDHMWLLLESNDEALIGITFFAQDTLGDIVEINLPNKTSMISKGVSCGSIESRKAVSDIVAPAHGVVIEVNEALTSEPYLMNDDPYKKGWIAKIKLANPQVDLGLMDADQYKKHIGE